MTTIIAYISLVLLMLVTGVFWGTWFSLSRSLEKISPENFLENGRIMIANLAWPMRILMPLTLLAMGLVLWSYPDKSNGGFYLAVASLLFMIITLVITVGVEVPIDNKIKRWTVPALPDDWKLIRGKWQRYHTLRTFTAIISFCLLLAAVLLRAA